MSDEQSGAPPPIWPPRPPAGDGVPAPPAAGPPPPRPSTAAPPSTVPAAGAAGPPRPLDRRLLLGGALAVVAVAAAIGVALAQGGEADGSGTAPLAQEPVTEPASGPTDEEVAQEPSDGALESSPSPAPPPVEVLVPVSVSATAERESNDLRCTGERVSYSVDMLVDGDMDTGWGAGADDGAGQSATVVFDAPVHLTSIGLTPGYAKVGPRQDTGCQSVPAFDHNRWVPAVRYTFDDGSVVDQRFEPSPELQTSEVDVVTSSVRLTLLETALPVGADDDTVLSEIVFSGRRR